MAYLGMSYSFNQNSLPTMDTKVFFPANRLLPQFIFDVSKSLCVVILGKPRYFLWLLIWDSNNQNLDHAFNLWLSVVLLNNKEDLSV